MTSQHQISVESKTASQADLIHAPVANELSPDEVGMQLAFPILPKLMFGSPDDPLEEEAEATADQVMRMPDQSFIQRQCAHCREEENKIQRKSISQQSLFVQTKQEGAANAGTSISQTLQGSIGGGNQIEASTLNFMQSRFGADFSDVRIHTDQTAAQMNGELNARAFAFGKDIFFNQGHYQPGSDHGKHLLAHELTHTLQQAGASQTIRRASFGGPTTGVPQNWAADVNAATTSAQKVALIQSALGQSISVQDRTAQSARDSTPDPAHLAEFSASSATINYDDNLNSKSARAGGRSLSDNAGYTFETGSRYYVVLSSQVLDANKFFQIVQTVNHELGHISQFITGSSLTGNDSELDAWTGDFIREFHRMYVISESGSDCVISQMPRWTPLLDYYMRSGVAASEKQRTVRRITAYHSSVIAPHAAHLKALRLWLLRSMNRNRPDLANALNTALSLSITATDAERSYQRFSCTGITNLSFPTGPSLTLPAFPSGTPSAPQRTGAGGSPTVTPTTKKGGSK
jgi:hypothetical protein